MGQFTYFTHAHSIFAQYKIKRVALLYILYSVVDQLRTSLLGEDQRIIGSSRYDGVCLILPREYQSEILQRCLIKELSIVR